MWRAGDPSRLRSRFQDLLAGPRGSWTPTGPQRVDRQPMTPPLRHHAQGGRAAHSRLEPCNGVREESGLATFERQHGRADRTHERVGHRGIDDIQDIDPALKVIIPVTRVERGAQLLGKARIRRLVIRAASGDEPRQGVQIPEHEQHQASLGGETF